MDNRAYRTANIIVRGKVCIVEVHVKAAGLWEARGSLDGSMIVAEGTSSGGALAIWRQMAGA
ncbi:hypothetical protein [Mesorhizobium denitrificans]|uniref:Uncharacterized protein n=1 Tax=Mesorhizobium denitrificans TaxID=2294114 RepID=A0A371X6C9_9HYPH|nr:hypothetical protein [Mesorhizobium denitrificans]RFC64786.1 hypothetical protein DY251_18660 [Mesorhizobium denitrificans]